MRALVSTAFLVISLATPVPGAAEADALQAMAQLAQAAAGEAKRLRRAADDSVSLQAAGKALTARDGNPTARKSSRSHQLSTKLAESERLRIRNKYREQKKQLIAGRQAGQANNAIQPEPELTLLTDAD